MNERQQEKARKAAELNKAIRELNTLNTQEYTEIQGGKVVENQICGGGLVPVKGKSSWHERDTGRMMEMRHRYQKKGEWHGVDDRAHLARDEKLSVRLPQTLSSANLQDLANFIEFRMGRPGLVEAIRSQAQDALCGDVSTIYGQGITESYDVIAEVAEHREKYTYFYFKKDEQGRHVLEPSFAPGVEPPSDSASEELQQTKAQEKQ